VGEVNGFVGGTCSEFGNYLAVTQNQAHAWVEVWFPGYGWVPFDPTPAGGEERLAMTSWFWPGRILFDAIQHRWNKWVLDYSLQTQFTLFERGREALTANTQIDPDQTDGRSVTIPFQIVWWTLGGLLVLGAGVWSFGRNRGTPWETRMFLRLRDSGRRAGVPDPALHSPRSLTDYLESIRHPAAAAARRVVDGYVQARFSGLPIKEGQEEEITLALKDARTLLRRSAVR